MTIGLGSITAQSKGLAVALLIVGTTAAALRWKASSADVLFGSDEADYARAMSYGPAAAYLGTHERTGLAFVNSVVADYRRTGWARPFKQDWDTGDAAGLRHYHPPVGLYPVALLQATGVTDEIALRRASAITSALACVAVSLLGWFLAPGSPLQRASVAASAGLLAAVSPYHLMGARELGVHAAFSLFSTLALLGLVRFLETGSTLWWRVSWVAIGLTMLTVPYWGLLALPAAWAFWRSRRRQDLPRLARDAALVLLATLLVAWPPYLLAAGFVKPLFMYGGVVLKPLPGNGPGAEMFWLESGFGHFWIVALLAALIAGVIVSAQIRAVAMRAMPVVLFCLGFFLLNARVHHIKPLYAGDVVASAAALAGIALAWVPARMAVTGLILPAILLVQAARFAPVPTTDWRGPMATLQEALAGQRVLVTPRPAAAMMRYYLKRSQVLADSEDPSDQAELASLASSGSIDVVLLLGVSPEPDGWVAAQPAAHPPPRTLQAGPALITWWRH